MRYTIYVVRSTLALLAGLCVLTFGRVAEAGLGYGGGVVVPGAVTAQSIAAAGGVTIPNRILYVSTNGNDSTAKANDVIHPWKTVYDYTNNTWLGVMSVATNGDQVVFLTDNSAPVLPYFQPGVTVNLNGHMLIRTNTTASATWPISRADFNFPFVFLNDNCALLNGTLYHDIATNYGVPGLGSSYVFGMQLTPTKASGYIAGTNIDQILGDPNDNGGVGFFNATNFGRWAAFGITNNGGTNFVCDNVFFNQKSYDIAFVDNSEFQAITDTNGAGNYNVLLWKPTSILFKNCSCFTYWDAWIFKGTNVAANFINMANRRLLNFGYTNVGTATAVYTGGEASHMSVLGGSITDTTFGTNSAITAGIAGTRASISSATGLPATQIAIDGVQIFAEGTNFIDAVGTTPIRDIAPVGWYIWTNGLSYTLNTNAGSFAGNGGGLTNTPVWLATNTASPFAALDGVGRMFLGGPGGTNLYVVIKTPGGVLATNKYPSSGQWP